MIGSILTYKGEPPSALTAPDASAVIELFKQQNEILRLALTTCVIIPEGTRVSQVHRKAADEDQD